MAAHADDASSQSLRISAAASTDTGRVRKRNEDAFVVFDLDHEARTPNLDGTVLGSRGILLAVADGMGGKEGGDLASMLATEAFVGALADSDGCAEKVLEVAMNDAHAVIREAADELGLEGMGTTLTAVHLCGGVARVAHVGDSRAYLARDHELLPLTRDHTIVQAAVDAGKLSPAEARTSPMRHLLVEAVGSQPRLRLATNRIDVRDGDRLVLCTDGLTEYLDDDAILDIVEHAGSDREAVERLVLAANERGGRDNITAVVATVADAQ